MDFNVIDVLSFFLPLQEVAEAFSTYCGIAIIHSLMYKKVVDAQHRSKLSNELMMYHMKVSARYVHRERRHIACTHSALFVPLKPVRSI